MSFSLVIPAPSLAAMGIAGLLSIVIPFIVFIVIRKKTKADALPFFVGFAVFILFALVIEGALNYVIFNVLPVGKAIAANIFLYALVGGLMAGIFEETGRFVAFRTVLKKRNGNDENALMYGAGHGGIESIITVGLTYISYIFIAIMLSIGAGGALTDSMPAESAEQFDILIKQLAEQPAWVYAFAVVERCIAIAGHISFSVLVWFAAKRKKSILLYPLAILLHAAYDAALVLFYRGLNASVPVTELFLAGLMAPLAAIAVIVWKRHKKQIASETPDEEPPAEEAFE